MSILATASAPWQSSYFSAVRGGQLTSNVEFSVVVNEDTSVTLSAVLVGDVNGANLATFALDAAAASALATALTGG